MTLDKMENNGFRTIDALMRKNGFTNTNKIDNPTGFILEYENNGESYLVVFNTRGRVTNIM